MRLMSSFALVLSLLVGGCKSSDPPLADAGPEIDQTICKRPAFALCEAPPFGSSCPDKYFCPGCNCAGQAPAPACNPLGGQDCRYFCDGCYPEEYVLCDAETAQKFPALAGRCGYCFLQDDGPDKCNTLGDAGATPRDAG